MDTALFQAVAVFLGDRTRKVIRATDKISCPDEPVAVVAGLSSQLLAARLRSHGFTSIRRFVIFPTARSVRWIIPARNHHSTRVVLQTYTAYGARTRWLKRLLLATTRLGWTALARDKLLVGSRQPLEIESLVSDITGEPQPVFALTLGTQGAFRKLSIQVMRPDGEILGYIKLPMTVEAIERVRHEAAMLGSLFSFVVLRSQIPRVLHAGAWGESYILFQSAGPLRPAPVEFGKIYRDFLAKLWSIEGVKKPGETLVEEVGARWRKAEVSLDSVWRSLGDSALRKASQELEKMTIQCGVTHGDFAPWNSRVSDGQLYLFDWESAEWQAPRDWDIFHFHVQVSSLLKRSSGSFPSLNRLNGERASFLLYLLNSACHCLEEKSSVGEFALTNRRRLLAHELSLN